MMTINTAARASGSIPYEHGEPTLLTRIIKGKAFIAQNGIFLLLVLTSGIALKHHYSEAGTEGLAWILRPTAALVEQMSGIPFEEETRVGWVNYSRRIIIAPACAGVNFLIIAYCMTAFFGICRIENRNLKWMWLAGAIGCAYGLTVLVNAVRITVAIYSYEADLSSGWLTPDRVHRLEGVVIYFFFLCLFYSIMSAAFALLRKQNAFGKGIHEQPPGSHGALAGLVPLFWYGLITIAVPVINGTIAKNGSRFAEHCAMVITGSLGVLTVLVVVPLGCKGLKQLNHKLHESWLRVRKSFPG